MSAETHTERSKIEAALLEFQRTPGRHIVALRQPALLFSSLKEVMQIASGRSAHKGGQPPSGESVRAACTFIRAAMLYPGATPYAILGLTQDAGLNLIKDRYRLMMRLMHPDFASHAPSHAWPADAATRINQAYEVLSSPQPRKAYDEQFKPAASHAQAPGAKGLVTGRSQAVVAGKSERIDPRQGLRWLATSFGAAGALAVLAAWFASGQPDKETLVQRAAATKAGAVVSTPAPALVLVPVQTPQETVVARAAQTATLDAPPAPAPTLPQLVTAPQPMPLAIPKVADSVPARPAMPPLPPVQAAAPVPVLTSSIFATAMAATQSPAPAATSAPAVPVANRTTPVPVPVPVPVSVAVSVAAPALAAAPVLVSQMQATPTPVPPPPAAPAAKSAIAVPTMAGVHQQLVQLLQQVESGLGFRVLGQLDREARSSPSAQALLDYYNGLVDGVKPVRVASVDFIGEPRDERLVVSGRIVLQVRDTLQPNRQLALQAEFVNRNGAPVLVRLARLSP